MVGLDSRRQPATSHVVLWRQARWPVIACLLLTLGLVMKLEITEAALRGAEVSPRLIIVVAAHFALPFHLQCK